MTDISLKDRKYIHQFLLNPRNKLTPGVILRGALLPEPIEVITIIPVGISFKIIGRRLNTSQVHQPILSRPYLVRQGNYHGQTPFTTATTVPPWQTKNT